jgi:hypothetical protein
MMPVLLPIARPVAWPVAIDRTMMVVALSRPRYGLALIIFDCFLHQAIHWHIWFHESGFGMFIDLDNIRQRARVYHVSTGILRLTGTVGRTMVDTKWFFALVKPLHAA